MTNESRIPAGVPTGGQFAASAKGESSVALANANSHPDVLAAIAKAKETGKPVMVHALGSTGFNDGENDSSCGDCSLGKEPSNRMTWATGNDDEPFITATTTYFVTARRDGDLHDLDYDDWTDAEAERRAWEQAGGDLADDGADKPEVVRYSVEQQTEWLGHTDVAEPGCSEVRSDHEPGPGSDVYFDSLESANNAAANQAMRLTFDHYAPEHWK